MSALKFISKFRWLAFAAVLLAVIGAALHSDVSSQEPPPRPEKLDAFLGGLLAAQQSRIQSLPAEVQSRFEAVQWKYESFPFHKDAQGRVFLDALIKTDGSLDGLAGLGVIVQGVVGKVVAARVPLASVARLSSLRNVEVIQTARRLSPTNDVSVPATGAPSFRTRTGREGSGVIVGVIDTGVDFTHLDFRKADSSTRIKFLCDQTSPPQAGDNTCPGGGSANGGTLWTEQQINLTLAGTGPVRQTDSEGHGTHVLGSAAGDDATYSGMAPGADIIMVKTTFFTNDIVNAIGFIDTRATSLGRPYVINLSLGGHVGPHDGTDPMSQVIDALTGAGNPGKVVVVSAGNEGSRNIHANGDLRSGTQTVSFNVDSGMQVVLLSIWYAGQDSFCFNFTSPGGTTLDSCKNPGESFSGCIVGTSTCAQLNHSVTQVINNSKEIFLLIGPRSGVTTIDLTGTWRFTLSGNTVNLGRFDAWIECFTPSRPASCPFTSSHGNSDQTVGQPGVARKAITVGSYVTKDCWPSIDGNIYCWNPRPTVGGISPFSSKGPTRAWSGEPAGRRKPDIAAPGEGVVSTRSKDATFPAPLIAPDGKHVVNRGTSMSAPHVTGAVALLLATNPNLDADQIKALLQGHTIRDAFTGTSCNNTWGCGKLDIAPRSPVVNAGPDVTINEGSTFTSSGSFTDPDLDTWSATVDYGDGSGVQPLPLTPGKTFTLNHVYADNRTYTVTVTVRDDLAGVGSDTATVTVNNVAPTLSNVTVTSPINENGTATLQGNITDPGTQDTFTLAVNWGDGTTFEGTSVQTFSFPAGTTLFSVTHRYLDDNPSGTSSDNYGINLALKDDDTGSATASTQVTVNNLPPALSNVTVTSPINENGIATLQGNITDPGTQDTFTLAVNWGDGTTFAGTSVQTFSFPAGTTSFSVTHRYLDDNPSGTASDSYTINLTLTDDDTGRATASAQVVVNNLAPVVIRGRDQAVLFVTVDTTGSGTLTLTTGNPAATFTDAGILDTHTATINWGDGTPPGPGVVTEATGSSTGNVFGSHVYTVPGTYTVTVTVTDDDGGVGSNTFTVTVARPLDPNSISLSDLAITLAGPPRQTVAEVRPGQQVDLGFRVTNAATGSGVFDLRLLVNGALTQVRSLFMQANSSLTFDDFFTFTPLTAGTYSVRVEVVNGPAFVVGSFEARPPPCGPIGDVNCDGVVNVADLKTIAAAFRSTNPAADLDHSGLVDVKDLALAARMFTIIPMIIPIWHLDLQIVQKSPQVPGGVDLLIGVKSGCPEPPSAIIGNAPGCYGPIPPSFGVRFDNYLDNLGNPDSDLKRLYLSLPPRLSAVREWVVKARNLGHPENLIVTFQWDSTLVPGSVDLRLLPSVGAEINMRSSSSFTLTLGPAPSSAQFTIRATAP